MSSRSNQTVSHDVDDKALYSAYVVLLATTYYFLLFHEIKLFPRNKQNPVTDFFVSKQAPQFESLYPLRLIFEFLGKNNP